MKLSSTEAERELLDLGGVPVDRVAWRVLQRGERYEPQKKVTQLMFDAPPPMSSLHNYRGQDLTGARVGRMTVIGYWGKKKGRTKDRGSLDHVWVCRCPCGLFVTRTAHTIKRARDPDDKCEQCRHLAYLKRAHYYRLFGRNLDEPRA